MIIPFTMSAILVMYFDGKYKEIPLWLILYNYFCLVILTNEPLFLFGFIFIFLCYKFNKPIDLVYNIVLLYLLLGGYNAIGLIFLLINIFFIKDKKVSFMVGLECALILCFI